MGGEGTMSGMISSLKNNNRRGKYEHFEKEMGVHIEKTEYNFPVVSEEKKEEVVQEIMRKRSLSKKLNYLVLGILAGIFILFIGGYLIAMIAASL
ncbi:MAG: hypothetical protein QNK23_17860 [Crocinitomicaceae bacterium]|nr:hypothetical protein [Crocinitomicaceae bacterium]